MKKKHIESSRDLQLKNNHISLFYFFICNLLTIFFSYCTLIRTHFAIDTYNTYYNTTASQHLQLGRICSFFIAKTLSLLNINPAVNQAPFTIFLIITMACCCTYLLKKISIFYNDLSIGKTITLDLSILLSFINIYILEWYLFPESTITAAFNLVTLTLAVSFACDICNFKNILLSFIFLSISLNIYQINITLFIIFVMTIILIKNDFNLNKSSVLQSASAILIGFMSSFANIIILKILQHLKYAVQDSRSIDISISSLVTNFKVLFLSGQKTIWIDGSGFFPKYMMLIFLTLSIAYMIYLLVSRRLKPSSYIFVACILIINYAVIFVPHMMTKTIWLAPRTIVGIFTVLTSIFLIIIKLYKKGSAVGNRLFTVGTAVLATFLILNIYQIQTISVDHIACNKIDREYILQIHSRIQEYETQNNITVNNIAIQGDEGITYGYYNSLDYINYDTNIRPFAVSWADVCSINCITGRNFNKVEMNDIIYNLHFKGKNWSYFKPEEQMVFDGNTLYLIVY